MTKQVLEGWLTRDKKKHSRGGDLTLWLSYEPERDYDTWVGGGCFTSLPKELFNEQTWDMEPAKVTITIESNN